MNRGRGQSGQSAVMVIILLSSVLVVFLGFAWDLGRLYLIRGELNVAADAMALAAAGQLIGTSAAAGLAQSAVNSAQNSDNGGDNRFNFGGTQIGGQSGQGGQTPLTSEVEDLELYGNYNTAVSGDPTATVDPTLARYVRVRVRADAPLTFWRLLPGAEMGITTVMAAATAGVSAPLCSVCGIPPLAVLQLDATDTTNFGFVQGLQYTFYSQCAGAPPPSLAGTVGLAEYTVLNRALENGADTDQQVFEMFAGGIPSPGFPVSSDSNLGCPTIGVAELRLPSLSVVNCANTVLRGSIPRDALCGLNVRLNATPNTGCEAINNVDSLIQSFPTDTDVQSESDYVDYTGNQARILTAAVVDSVPFAVTGTMNIVGFRQFLLQPTPGSTEVTPGDPYGRFVAMYIGYPAPVKQGDFGACGVTLGPGKVVLHQ